MAFTPTVDTEHALEGGLILARGSIAASGNYAAGGDPVAFAGLVKSTTLYALFVSGMAGFVYQWDQANALLLIFEAGADGAALDELGAGALPGGVTGDTIRFVAYFRKFL
ncbi:hypothetical protein LCGC14_2148370 [marine sediment metagenome]|uniref:Uncharacterized protein n=1 Tax=marine sediment metagenome TaxID=412755 RepID=A0A0F9EIG0_9ZZZZ